MSCQTPMLWALAATGLLYWVVSFQASTRISIMLFKRARRGAKGKDATNNVTNPNWITVEKKRKIHKLIIVERKMGTSLPNSWHILHFGGIYNGKTLHPLSTCPLSPLCRKYFDFFPRQNGKEKLGMHSSVLSLVFLLRYACLKKAYILVW